MLKLRNISEKHPWQQPPYMSWLALGLFFIIGILPIISMFFKSFIAEGGLSLQHYKGLFTYPDLLALFLKSFLAGLGATVFSIMFGLPLAIFLIKYDFKGKRVFSLIYLIPLFVPPHVHGAAWLALLEGESSPLSFLHINLHSLPGTSFILFVSYFPLFVLAVMTGLRNLDTVLEDAAKLNVDPARVLREITLPLCSPYLTSGAVFVFIFSFFNYGVPATLKVTSLSVELFNAFGSVSAEGTVTALSMPLVILALILLYVQKKVMLNSSYVTIQRGSGNHRIKQLKKVGRVTAFVWVFFTIAIFIPFFTLVVQAGGLKSYQVALITSATEIKNSIWISSIAATVATVLAFFIATFVEECESRWRDLLDALTWLPFAFPGGFFAIGLTQLWSRGENDHIQSTVLFMILICICRFIPFAVRILLANLKQLSPGLKEAAVLCQDNRVKRFWVIDFPLLRKGMCMCWLVIFIFSMGELGATKLIMAAGDGTISSKIYMLMQYGEGQLVAAFSVILVLINLLVAFLILRVGQKNEKHKPV